MLGSFIHRDEADGCMLCTDDGIGLSMDRAPPPQRAGISAKSPTKRQSESTQHTVRKRPEDFVDKTMNVVNAVVAGVEKWKEFRKWVDGPLPERPPKVLKMSAPKAVEREKPFDIQDMPGMIRKLGMPKAAQMFDRWFEGELNYSLTNADANEEINHLGEPYSPSMIDKDSISIDWVLNFPRAKQVRDKLIEHQTLTTVNATGILQKIFRRNTAAACLNTWEWCKGDIRTLHHEFQFQRLGVEGSWKQKLSQYSHRLVTSRGLPDELTMILGSFNLNAAVSRAVLRQEGRHQVAEVTHIYVYARDGFTFTDEPDDVSQYLGHWNRNTIAIVPAQVATSLFMNNEWVDGPVYQDPLRPNFDVLYPIKNSDFRQWQIKYARGGDYIIYTDRQPVRLAQPVRIEL
ncbi:hypothetical protein GN316_07240 [Xylophilus sp. Kf1]|nr:hypothetical protein [Xylophilus sp. Kf1]